MSTWAVYVAVATAHAPPRAHFEPVLAVFGPWGCTQATKWHIDCPYCFPPTVCSIWGATGPIRAVYIPATATYRAVAIAVEKGCTALGDPVDMRRQGIGCAISLQAQGSELVRLNYQNIRF